MSNIITNFWDIVTNPHFYIVVILVIIVIAVIHHIQIKSEEKSGKIITGKPVNKSIVNPRRILYMLVYVYYGYHFSHYFKEFVIMAIIFKFMDKGICSDSFLQAFDCDTWPDIKNKILCRSIYAIGSCTYDHTWSDVVLNMSGFILGMFIYKMIHRKKLK